MKAMMKLAMAAVLLGIGLGSCGDDEPVAPKPVGFSAVTMMHADPSEPGTVEFRGDTAALAALGYGTTGQAVVPNTSAGVAIRRADGSQLASARMQPDSSVSVWVILSGTSQQHDAYQIRTSKIVPAAGKVGLRVVHASSGAPDLRVRLNTSVGTAITPVALGYRSATTYVDLPVASTGNLVVVADSTTTLMTIPVAGQLEAGSLYTVVLYGSTDSAADPSVRLTYRMVKE